MENQPDMKDKPDAESVDGSRVPLQTVESPFTEVSSYLVQLQTDLPTVSQIGESTVDDEGEEASTPVWPRKAA